MFCKNKSIQVVLCTSLITIVCAFSSSGLSNPVVIGSRIQSNNAKRASFSHLKTSVDSAAVEELDVDGRISSWNRLVLALPSVSVERNEVEIENSKRKLRVKFGDELDRKIFDTAIPSMINLAVVPIVNSVDTFWVGRMGIALALAGQAAANQAFFTLYFLIAFLPTITAPLVAKAVGSDDPEAAQSRVCEALFLSNIFGGLGTILLVGFPRTALQLVLSKDAPALQYAVPYLRLRGLSMVPALFSATGFAAYRGLLNTVTPLKVSLVTNAINLVLDPLFIFKGGLGAAGAALATAGSEMFGGLIYLRLLLRRKLVRWSRLLKPPAKENLIPLLQGGMTMLLRQATLNGGFLLASRRAQTMDPSGVACDENMHIIKGITMQIYNLAFVLHLGVQSTAATLVPSALAKGSVSSGRSVADRIFLWGTFLGFALAAAQYIALPYLVPVFTTLPDVQEAIKLPALISSFTHILNGPLFPGEGVMLGLGTFKALATVTAMGIGTMVACLLSPMGKRLDGILLSMAAFHLVQAVGVTVHHLRIGPLRRKNLFQRKKVTSASHNED